MVYQHRLSAWTQDVKNIKKRSPQGLSELHSPIDVECEMHVYLSQEHAQYTKGTILYTENEELSRSYPGFYYFYSEGNITQRYPAELWDSEF